MVRYPRSIIVARIRQTPRHLWNRVDVYVAGASLLVGVVVSVHAVTHHLQSLGIIVGLPLLIAPALRLLLRGLRARRGTAVCACHSTSATLIGCVLSIGGMAGAALVCHQSVVRPDSYYALMTVAAGGIVLQSLCVRKGGIALSLVLSQGLVLAALLRAHGLFESPCLTMSDIGAHKAVIEVWMEQGHVTLTNRIRDDIWYEYASYPLMQISVIQAMLMTALPFKSSLFIAVGVPFVASILFVYITAARDTGWRLGLCAVVFLAVAAPHMYWGILLIPTTMGVTLFCAVIYLSLFWRHTRAHALLFILLSVALVLTHTASAIIALFAVAAVALVQIVAQRVRQESLNLVPLTGVILFCAVLLAVWTHAYFTPRATFFQMVMGGLLNSTSDFAGLTPNIIYAADQNPLDWAWLGFTAGLLVLGTLQCLQPSERTVRRLAIIVALGCLCGAVLLFPLLGMRNILPHRWLPFIFSLGAPLMMVAVKSSTIVGKGSVRNGVCLVVLLAFTALSLFSSGAHPNSPFMSNPVPQAWSASENAAGAAVTEWAPETITVDTYFKGLAGELQLQQYGFVPLSTRVRPVGVVVVRATVRDTMYETSTVGTWQVGSSEDESKEYQLFSALEDAPSLRIYSNNSVDVFLSPE